MTKSKEKALLRRPVEWWERRKLESNGCHSLDWSRIRICDATDLDAMQRVEFVGAVSVGVLNRNEESAIENCRLENCTIGDNARIRNIGIGLRNIKVCNGARIEDCGLIEFNDESS
ncbi:MAG: DUF4954 family protein [Muribaculaceae bacterium]|nr:DUF4954 family protein [Muribaculaceae bacterium]